MSLRISDLPVVSLDLETSGLLPGSHVPLSIGAVFLPHNDSLPQYGKIEYEATLENSFYVQLEWDDLFINTRAMRVNKLNIMNPPGPSINRQVLGNRSLPAIEGIKDFSDWLKPHIHGTEYVYALGLNVGSFDLPMLKSIWQGSWPFSYRSFDLNTIFFVLSQLQNKPFEVIKDEISEIAWRNNGLSNELKHHALYDAWSNVYMFQECMRRFRDGYEVKC